MGPDITIFIFWMLSLKLAFFFSLSSFTFIKRLFSSSSFSAIRVVSSTYLRLLIFLLAILIPACASSSLAFHMMCSSYTLNEQGWQYTPLIYPFPNFEPVQWIVTCPILTVASWPTCIHVSQEEGKVVWYTHRFMDFPVCCDPHSHRI